jgi:hypothetical protein
MGCGCPPAGLLVDGRSEGLRIGFPPRVIQRRQRLNALGLMAWRRRLWDRMGLPAALAQAARPHKREAAASHRAFRCDGCRSIRNPVRPRSSACWVANESPRANHSAPQLCTNQATDRRGLRSVQTCDLCTRSQRLDDATVGNSAALASIDELVQHAAQFDQTSKLAFHVGQVSPRKLADFGAGALPIIGYPHQIPHCVQRISQLAAPPEETQPLNMRPPIGPVIATCARRRRQQTNPFIVMHGLSVGTGNSSEFANGKCLGEHCGPCSCYSGHVACPPATVEMRHGHETNRFCRYRCRCVL